MQPASKAIAQADSPTTSLPYDAILIVGFGGPEGRDDVMPFLENVTRGRNIPRERLLEVAEHYYHFEGVSPINAQVRALMDALKPELVKNGIALRVYWGNRNWHPMLADTIRQMKADGVKHALGVVLAAYSSYSSCRQYREDLGKACDEVGEGAPTIDKMRVFFNHPGFIEANAERVEDALGQINAGRHDSVHLAFTAHSIPSSMAVNCDYEKQLTETCRLVAEKVGIPEGRWKLVYQSRSGRPQDPWLEPDILDHLDDLQRHGVTDLVIHPVGFLSDHMEVLYDLDDEAKQKGAKLGINVVRAATVGTHPAFVKMLRELIVERIEGTTPKPAVGNYPANHDVCPVQCCLPSVRPAGAGRPAST
jgi:ferrochelatase